MTPQYVIVKLVVNPNQDESPKKWVPVTTGCKTKCLDFIDGYKSALQGLGYKQLLGIGHGATVMTKEGSDNVTIGLMTMEQMAEYGIGR